MTKHSDHKWNLCECGNEKIATAVRCQVCHTTKHLPRRRKLKARWHDLSRAWVDGAEIRIGKPAEMEAREFVAVIADVINST